MRKLGSLSLKGLVISENVLSCGFRATCHFLRITEDVITFVYILIEWIGKRGTINIAWIKLDIRGEHTKKIANQATIGNRENIL